MNELQWSLLQERHPSPLYEAPHPVFQERGLRLMIKRDDLLHWPGAPAFGGNKWRKLKYNLLAARKQGFQQLLTFGGAFSNHLAAVAAAGKALGFTTIGIVRGERPEGGNPTLDYCEACGMSLQYVSRTEYRQLATMHENWSTAFPDSYVLPEGGSNLLALQGCAELADEIVNQIALAPTDYVAAACGTGATLAGIAAGGAGRFRTLGIPVVGGGFMSDAVAGFLAGGRPHNEPRWELDSNYTFGGYARFNNDLIDFIHQFYAEYQIPLDPIYTGKLFYGLIDLARKKFFTSATIIAVHTGGLQGLAGFNQRWGNIIKL